MVISRASWAGAMQRHSGVTGQFDLAYGRPEEADGSLGIGRVEQRQWRVVPGVPVLAGVFGVLHLEMRRVAQHDRRDVRRTWGADHRAVEAFADQARQVAAVVQVGVGEDDSRQ